MLRVRWMCRKMSGLEESTRLLRRLTAAVLPDVALWAAFLLLNAILFLPFYLLTRQQSHFWPVPEGKHIGFARWLLHRGNYDPFRLNAEVVGLLALWVWVRWLWKGHRRRWYRWLFVLVFFVALVYQVYAGVDILLYHNEPAFYNDLPFMTGGVKFVLDSLQVPSWYYPAAVLALVAALGGLYALASAPFRWIPVERLKLPTRIAMALLAAAAIAFVAHYGSAASEPQMEVDSLTLQLADNFRRSLIARKAVGDLNRINPYEFYDYAHYHLRKKPNVYLFFVESYGSVLYTDSDFHDDYVKLLEELQKKLDAAGFHEATALSISPTWGGGSWMAYTSAMFGVRVNKQPLYLALREKYQVLPYPNLGRYLHSQGYEYVWLVPIARKLTPKEQMENSRFYGPDRWITFEDLGYHGPMYGWGPSPPDQYTLGFTQEFLKRNVHKPVFLFFLTQASHFPFAPLPPMVDDWRMLNDPNIDHPKPLPEPISYRERVQDYKAAIRYGLNLLTDFALNMAGPDDVVVLIGDHQPPAVSGPWEGYATPIHVISRNAKFVDGFQKYGFVPGMVPGDGTPDMHHEGLYSMLVRQLLAVYGEDAAKLPPYMPHGIEIHRR
jgi:hypothetical protein